MVVVWWGGGEGHLIARIPVYLLPIPLIILSYSLTATQRTPARLRRVRGTSGVDVSGVEWAAAIITALPAAAAVNPTTRVSPGAATDYRGDTSLRGCDGRLAAW